jgi:hypothetical protein
MPRGAAAAGGLTAVSPPRRAPQELAEATAEEAGKKLKEAAEEVSHWNGEAGRAARVLARPPPPDPRDLAAYGVTPALAAHARALGIAAFREHPAAGAAAAPPPPLSAWRVRHALLAVRAAPEVDALRFALCPRYMDDGRFWAAYFDLCREHLPDAAFAWREGDELPELRAPAEPDAGGGVDPAAALVALGGQLRELGGRAGAAAAGTAAGAELAALLQRGVAGLGAALPAGAASAPPPPAPAPGPPSPRPLLAADPDLEEFMQGAGSGSDPGGSADGGGAAGADGAGGVGSGAASGGEEDGEDDLDRYITELAAEVDGSGGEGGAEGEEEEGDAELEADVDAALRELEDGGEEGEGEEEEEKEGGGEEAAARDTAA